MEMENRYESEANRFAWSILPGPLEQLPWKFIQLPWKFELNCPYPDVVAAFRRFFVMRLASNPQLEGMTEASRVRRMPVLHRNLTAGSSCYTVFLKPGITLAEIQLDSIRKGTATHIQMDVGSLPPGVVIEHDQFPLVYRDFPNQEIIISSVEELRALLLWLQFHAFLVWFYQDQHQRNTSIQIDVAGPVQSDGPPHPHEAGWNAVFDWYYRYGVPKRMTISELADKIGYSPRTVSNNKVPYDAQRGTAIRRKKGGKGT